MSETPPKVSIVIPTYNALEDLRDCVASIIREAGSQLGSNLQLTVQDGLSSDGTQQYLSDLGIKGISYVSEADEGIYDAMNRAVKRCSGEWVLFLGADDRLSTGFTDACAALQDKSTIYYGNVVFTSDGRQYDGRFNPLKLVYRNICHQAIFCPRALLTQSPFDTRFVTHADWAKNIELMSEHRFEYLDFTIARYRDRLGASGTISDIEFAKHKAALFYRHHGLLLSLLSRTAAIPTAAFHLLKGRG